MELEIIKKLGFNVYIEEEMYNIYKDEIQTFSQTQSSSLIESLNEYKVNQKRIREYSKLKRMSKSKLCTIQNEENKYSDFVDLDIMKFIEEKWWFDQNTAQPCYIPKFRFESYNNHDFKCDQDFRKSMRSRSESKYDD